MRRPQATLLVLSLALLLTSCGSTDPAPVAVLGVPEELGPLNGEWIGTYSGATGRSGSITFHLTDNAEGAHGDVLMIPKQDIVYNEHPSQYPTGPHGMTSSARVLSIEFVRVSGGEINGRIAPYPDPEMPDATLETHFTGRLEGDSIAGTFVTHSDRGITPRRGTWRVRRKSVP